MINLDLLTFKTISYVESLSHSLPKNEEVSKLSSDKKDEVLWLNRKIVHLKEELENYKPLLLQWIFDLFRLKVLKVYLLRRSLRKIIPIVQKIASEILPQQSKETLATIDRKKDLIKACQIKCSNHKTNDTAKKVDSFFKEKLKDLEAGYNTPIPFWYHATKPEKFPLILKDAKIKCFDGWYDVGAYISSMNETEFGSVAFAFDDDVVNKLPAKTIGGWVVNKPDSKSQWIAVRTPIPIKGSTLAYMVQMHSKSYLHEAINPLSPLVSIISYEEDRLIYNIIKSVQQRELFHRKKPAGWESWL